MDEEDQNGITAYHGSPHDFEKFDTGEIGTGEGHQSYGHGLYFAEAEPVAKAYRDRLAAAYSPPSEILKKYFTPGEIVPSYGGKDKVIDYDPKTQIATVQGIDRSGNLEHIRKHSTIPSVKEINQEFARRGLPEFTPGHMYEVAIDAHPDHFLDWDKPLSEQSEHVRNALQNNLFLGTLDRETGAQAYRDAMPIKGEHDERWKEASKRLYAAGIHGIRYLDAGSRGTSGQPTHNYVVFDHNRVKIKRKYERGGFVNGYNDGGFIPHGDPRRDENLNRFLSNSKVRKGNGEHAVLYHITPKNFDQFKAGGEDPTLSGPAIWLSPNKHNLPAAHNVGGSQRGYKEGTNVMPVYANIKSPLVIDNEGMWQWAKEVYKGGSEFPYYLRPETKQALIDDGYDGIFFSKGKGNIEYGTNGIGIGEQPHGEEEILAFHPHQIKSAIGNNGNFDPQKPSINEKRGGFVRGYNDGGGVEPEINNPMSVFPKPQRMFPEDAPVPGGQYLSMPDQTDMTGHKSAAASIGVRPGGKPYFTASRDAVDVTGTPGRGSATAKTNLFKQKAGWNWKDAPEGHENTNTIVSVEHRGQHHYALNAHFPKGVDLARYENSTSEPRLRPTTKGNVEFGPQAGSILVRGREHPVYHHVIVKNKGGSVKRPTRATGGRIPDADKLFKEAKKELDRHTKPMLSVDDDAIVNALRIAQGRV